MSIVIRVGIVVHFNKHKNHMFSFTTMKSFQFVVIAPFHTDQPTTHLAQVTDSMGFDRSREIFNILLSIVGMEMFSGS
jgi:hypothetical protein